MRRSKLLLILVFPGLLAALLTGCAPGTQALVAAPSFTVVAQGTGFQYVDPPGVGDGAAVFDVRLRAHNPNPVGLRLARLDGDLYLDGRHAAATSFAGGVDLPAQGNAELTLRVHVPLAEAPALLRTIASLVSGGATSYRLDAVVGVDILGTVQTFPRATLARGTVRASLGWVVPEIRVAASGAALRVDSLTHAVLEVPATLHNGARLGYVVRAPTVHLSMAGRSVATLRLDRIVAPAGSTVPVTLRFAFDPLQIGPALAAQLQAIQAGAGSVTFRVAGPLVLEAPGIGSRQLPQADLLSGRVR